MAGVHTRQEAAALASSGERLLGQAPTGKSVLEVAGGADDVFLVDGGGHELRAVEPHDGAFIGRAFQRFSRCVRDPDGQRGSAGLGLAVVSTIARAHGGRAWAENRPEGGARVTMIMNDGAAQGQPP